MKVFQTFFSRILQILPILAILLQTAERSRGTGPRATGAGARFFSLREGFIPRAFFLGNLVSLQRQGESSSFHINRIACC